MATNQSEEDNSSFVVSSSQVGVKLTAEANDDIFLPYTFRINMSISTKYSISILIVILFNLLISLREMFILVMNTPIYLFRHVSATFHNFL